MCPVPYTNYQQDNDMTLEQLDQEYNKFIDRLTLDDPTHDLLEEHYSMGDHIAAFFEWIELSFGPESDIPF